MYHDLAGAEESERIGFPGPLAARYKLTPEHFEAHLDGIESLGRTVGLWDPGADGWPEVAITFDDGGASAPRAAEALERRGWRGHFFVTTGRLGTPGFMTGEQVRDLHARGHAIGGHSHNHPTYFGRLPRAEQLDEWSTSLGVLTDLLGAAPYLASVPGGFLTADAIATASEAGYRALMTSEPTARPLREQAIVVHGRYTIWATTSVRQAAGYAGGSRIARGRLWTEWRAKQAIKRTSPRVFEAARRLRARR